MANQGKIAALPKVQQALPAQAGASLSGEIDKALARAIGLASNLIGAVRSMPEGPKRDQAVATSRNLLRLLLQVRNGKIEEEPRQERRGFRGSRREERGERGPRKRMERGPDIKKETPERKEAVKIVQEETGKKEDFVARPRSVQEREVTPVKKEPEKAVEIKSRLKAETKQQEVRAKKPVVKTETSSKSSKKPNSEAQTKAKIDQVVFTKE